MNDAKTIIKELLESADVRINGKRSWDIQVHNQMLFSKVLTGGSLALGETYMNSWWDVKDLDKFFYKILRAKLDKKVKGIKNLLGVFIKSLFLNMQSKSRAFEVGEKHYDIGNNLYRHMLDKRMNYSCGYWKDAKTLDKAQELKLDLICRKLGLKKGMTVLDIGCGWGGFAKYAAEKYGVKVLGITISKEQAKLAREICKGLPVEIRIQDYRDLNERFDRIVSIGMIEHVGYKNYRTFMKTANKCLKDNGIFLLHTIGSNKSVTATDPWTTKYIFPNGMLPSLKQLMKSTEGLFITEDLHNFGAYYDNTLMSWRENFVKNWDKIKKDYDKKFYRMWYYYLSSCAGSFRARHIQLWQLVLVKNGIKGGHESVR